MQIKLCLFAILASTISLVAAERLFLRQDPNCFFDIDFDVRDIDFCHFPYVRLTESRIALMLARSVVRRFPELRLAVPMGSLVIVSLTAVSPL